MHDKAILIAAFWGKAKRTLVFLWLLTILYINKAVWSPEALKVIGNPG
jgi:hypothetical protein